MPSISPFILTDPGQRLTAKLLPQLCSDPQWLLEEKFDGYRCLLRFDGANLNLITKNNREHRLPADFRLFTEDYLRKHGVTSLILDSELVGYNKENYPDFTVIRKTNSVRIFHAFDLLYLNGLYFRREPLVLRKKLLFEFVEAISKTDQLFRYVEHYTDTQEKIHKVMEIFHGGREGVVLKHTESLYGDPKYPWYKFKNKSYSTGQGRWRQLKGRS